VPPRETSRNPAAEELDHDAAPRRPITGRDREGTADGDAQDDETASGSDRLVAWSMIAGLAPALIQYAHGVALPARFV